jgi:hypothetical protein
MSGTASGQIDPIASELLWATLDAEVDITGDIDAAISLTADLAQGASDWTDASLEVGVVGTLMGHQSAFFGQGSLSSSSLVGSELSLGLSGDWAAWTIDGADMFAQGTLSGNGSGTVSSNSLTGLFSVSDASASGTWTGRVWNLASLKALDVGAGSGTAPLPGIATLAYEATEPGNIMLGEFEANPYAESGRRDLGKYIEVNSDILRSAIVWPATLRVYYTDEELAAAGIDETQLKMHEWTGEAWEEVGFGGINTSENCVVAVLDSFSCYAPMEEVSSQEDRGGGGGCFIATAAYGTPLEGEPDILRDFRDECLLTNPVGEALVEGYYSVSPPMADFIAERDGLRAVVRVGLVPVVVMSEVAMNTQLALMLLSAAFFCLILTVWAKLRRQHDM